MKQLYIDALRDMAIEYIPRAQKIRDNAAKMPNDHYLAALFETPIFVLGKAATPAIERAAAHLLLQVMQLSINWDEKLTTADRKKVEGYAVNAMHELCGLAGQSIPSWLPAAVEEVPEPEELVVPPQTSKSQIVSKPQPELPSPGTSLTTAEAAELLKVKPGTMRKWACKEAGPAGLRVIKNGRRNTYLSDDVIKLISEGWKP